jgi:hypothetical protein
MQTIPKYRKYEQLDRNSDYVSNATDGLLFKDA